MIDLDTEIILNRQKLIYFHQCSEEANKCKLCCPKEVNGKVQCLVASNGTNFPELQKYVDENNANLLPGFYVETFLLQ